MKSQPWKEGSLGSASPTSHLKDEGTSGLRLLPHAVITGVQTYTWSPLMHPPSQEKSQVFSSLAPINFSSIISPSPLLYSLLSSPTGLHALTPCFHQCLRQTLPGHHPSTSLCLGAGCVLSQEHLRPAFFSGLLNSYF